MRKLPVKPKTNIVHRLKDGRYYCNRVVHPVPWKYTEIPEKVTCLNCRNNFYGTEKERLRGQETLREIIKDIKID